MPWLSGCLEGRVRGQVCQGRLWGGKRVVLLAGSRQRRGGGETGRARPIIPLVNPRLNYKRIIHVQPWPHL